MCHAEVLRGFAGVHPRRISGGLTHKFRALNACSQALEPFLEAPGRNRHRGRGVLSVQAFPPTWGHRSEVELPLHGCQAP
jgi:hypothetical protein